MPWVTKYVGDPPRPTTVFVAPPPPASQDTVVSGAAARARTVPAPTPVVKPVVRPKPASQDTVVSGAAARAAVTAKPVARAVAPVRPASQDTVVSGAAVRAAVPPSPAVMPPSTFIQPGGILPPNDGQRSEVYPTPAPVVSQEQQQRDLRRDSFDNVTKRAASLAEQIRLGPAANRASLPSQDLIASGRAPQKSSRLIGASIADLEKMQAAEQGLQNSTAGRYFDAEYTSKLADAYADANKSLKGNIDKQFNVMDALLKSGNKDKAAALYNAPAFQKLIAEYKRVNGEGNVQGSAVSFYTAHNDMVGRQSQFLTSVFARQNLEAKQKQRALLQGLDPGDPPRPFLERRATYPQDVGVTPLGVWTPQMLAELSQNAYDAQLRDRRQAHDAQIKRYRQLGLTDQGYDPKDLVLYKNLADSAKNGGFLSASGELIITGPEDLEGLVDKALTDWDAKHSAIPKGSWVERDLAQYTDMAAHQKAALWVEQENNRIRLTRAAYEKELFGVFGTTRRGILEKTVELPVIKEALTLFNLALGSVGTPVRNAAMEAGGELVGPGLDVSAFDILAGTGKRKNLTFGDLKDPFAIAESDLNPFKFATAAIGSAITTRPGTIGGFGFDSSPAAKARARVDSKEFNKQLQDTLSGGDVFGAMRAVGNYGSEPFSKDSSGANLLFQLVADPLTWTPLNVLKYPERVSHALAASASRAGVSKVAGFVKDFVTVGEKELARNKEIVETLAGLGAKDPEDYANQIMREVQAAGVGNSQHVVEKFLQEHELHATPINARQINSLVIESFTEKIKREGINYVSHSDVAKAAKAETDRLAAARAAEKQREKLAADSRIARESAANSAAGFRARNNLKTTRAVEEARAVATPVYGHVSPDPTLARAAKNAGLDEADWLARRADDVYNDLRAATTDAEKKVLRDELRNVNDAMDGVTAAKGRGDFVSWQDRERFAREVDSRYGNDIQDLYPERNIAPYAETDAQAVIEQARSLRRILVTSKVSGKRIPGNPVRITLEAYENANILVSEAIRGVRNRTAKGQSHIAMRSRKPMKNARKAKTRDFSLSAEEAAAKAAVLAKEGIDVTAYDAAHAVFRDSMVARHRNMGLISRAKAAGGDFTKSYRSLRSAAAKEEARIRLKKLSSSMYGYTHENVLKEFSEQHSVIGKQAEQRVITADQADMLAAAFHEITGVDVADLPGVQGVLDRGGTVPPMGDKVAMRTYMERIGAWTPRQIKNILDGKEVWSVVDEAEFWLAETGRIPPWADIDLMIERGVFHDYAAYQAFQREFGGYNDDLARSFATGKSSAELRAKVIEGTDLIKAKADLDAERLFMKSRYGDAVFDKTTKQFTALPWIMIGAELPPYYSKRLVNGLKIATDLVPPHLLPSLQKAIEKASERHWDRVKAAASVTGSLSYQDVLRFAYDVTDELLMSKEWLPFLAKQRGPLGYRALNLWSSTVRAAVTWHPAFLLVNTPDVLVRSAWFRFSGRHVMTDAGPQAAARALEHVNPTFTSFYEAAGRKGFERARNRVQRGDSIRGLFEGITQLPGDLAGNLETGRKRALGARLYQSAYDDAVKRLTARGVRKYEKLADAVAVKYMKKELAYMFPTLELSHPLVKLFNELTPFLNYQLRNRVLWISEALLHPAMLNHIHYVGEAIRKQNLILWEKQHPNGEPMPEHLQTRIPLPWAPDTFLDLTVAADIGRGLSIFDTSKKRTVVTWFSQFLRLVSPTTQAAMIAITDATGLTGRWVWLPDGDGGATRVWRGLGEPWSGDPIDIASLLWPADALELWNKLWSDGKIDAGDAYQMFSKIAFYSEFSRVDPGQLAASTWRLLREKDREAAQAFWVAHPEIAAYFNSRATRGKDFYIPGQLEEVASGDPFEKIEFARRSPEYRQAVGKGFADLRKIEALWDKEIEQFVLRPWDPRLAEAKSNKRLAINQFYLSHPELIEHVAFGMSTADWAKQLGRWELDDKVDQYYKIVGSAPDRKSFKTEAEYVAARDEWEHQKETFLVAFPQVAETLGSAKSSVQQSLDSLREEWFETFGRMASRQDEIKALRASGNYKDADFLQQINDLDRSRLDFDESVHYLSANELKDLVAGNPSAGTKVLSQRPLVSLPDWSTYQWDRATPSERVTIVNDQYYSKGMQRAAEASKAARIKGGEKAAGAAFIAVIKGDPKLLALYFQKNEGKQEEWANTDRYIRLISKYGELAKASKWSEANAYFDALPQDVKDRYFKAHGTTQADRDKKQAYDALLGKYGALVGKKDYAGAHDYFASLPGWAKDMYYAKHKDKKVRDAANASYLGYMDQWSKLRDAENWDAANAYFEKMPSWVRERYFAKPGRKEAFQASLSFNAAMETWTGFMERKDFAGAAKYFDTLPKSMQDRYYNDPKKGADRRLARDYREALGPWASLVAAGKNDEASAAFRKLPQWVKDKYYNDPEKGPERRLGRQYSEALDPWAKLLDAGKYDEARAYFDELPKWMQDRYYNDPEKGSARRESREYQIALDPWAKLLDAGDFEGAKAYFSSLPQWMQDKYYNGPERGPERVAGREYGEALDPWAKLLDAGDFDGARAYFDSLPKWVKDRYYNDPEKGPERVASQAYQKALEPWLKLLDAKDFDGAKAYFDRLSPEMRDRYFSAHPEHRAPDGTYLYGGGTSRVQRVSSVPPKDPLAQEYYTALGPWMERLNSKDFEGAKAYFDSLPEWMRERYFDGHPEKRGPDGLYAYRSSNPPTQQGSTSHSTSGSQSLDFVDLKNLDEYFALRFEYQADYLTTHPELAQWLTTHTSLDKRAKFAILNGYKAIPAGNSWLKRIYREKYPELFSDEAVAKQKLDKTAGKLAAHPELEPGYQKFYDLINQTYAEALKHHMDPPREVESVHPKRKRHHD